MPEDGLILRGAAQCQLEMLPTQPLRPALYIAIYIAACAACVNGRAARHKVAARRKVRRRLAARSASILKPAAPDPFVALDGGHDLCRVSQNIGVQVVDAILLSVRGRATANAVALARIPRPGEGFSFSTFRGLRCA